MLAWADSILSCSGSSDSSSGASGSGSSSGAVAVAAVAIAVHATAVHAGAALAIVASTTDAGWAGVVPIVVHCCALGEVTADGTH